MLRITSTDHGLALAGELDMATADDLGTRLHEDGSADGELSLDFSDVTFMDSSGLRAILAAAGSRRDGSSIVIVNPPAQVRRLLEVSLPVGAPGLQVRA